MSETTIYFLKKDGCVTADFKNAFRSAMYIWQDVGKRYCGFDGFPMFSDDDRMEIWNYHYRHPGVMAEHEAITMLTTMDGALCEPDQWQRLADALEQYGTEHPNSSFAEQGMTIRAVMESDEAEGVLAIGWRQTSVGDTRWESFDDEGEELIHYDPESGDSHFWIMGQFDQEATEEAQS